MRWYDKFFLIKTLKFVLLPSTQESLVEQTTDKITWWHKCFKIDTLQNREFITWY